MKKGLFVILVAAMALASCHSSKKAAKENADVAQPTVVAGANAGSSSAKQDSKATAACLTAKVKARLQQGDMDISTSGTLRMRRDDVIQLTLMDPFLGVTEIGRMEISPDGILIIDRMNKRYVEMQVEDFPSFSAYGIDFSMVQEYVWGEVKGSGTLNYTIPARNAISLSIKASDINSNSNWEGHTNVADKYTKVSAEQLFKTLMK